MLIVVLIVAAGGHGDEEAATGSTSLVRALGATVGSLALGGALITTVLIERARTRYIVAAVIGLIAALFFDSAPSGVLTGSQLGDVAAAVAATCAAAAAGDAFFRWWTFVVDGPKARISLRATLIPNNWTDAVPAAPLTPKDLVSRWFVTIAASTGSIVGALMTQGAFWHAAARTLAPTHLIFTLLLMVISITLIGPLEEYIFGQRLSRATAPVEGEKENGAARGLIEDAWENFTPAAAGRLALVFLFSLQPALLDSCVGETVSRGDANATFLVLVSAFGPAITTYYWSAALQRGAPSVMKRAGESSTVLSAVLWYPVCLAFTALLFLLISRGSGDGVRAILLFLAIGIPIASVIAMIWGFLLNGIFAFAGGRALDYVRDRHEIDSWKALAMLGGVLFAANIVLIVAMLLLLRVAIGGAALRGTNIAQTVFGVLSTVGWVAGLAVSGFPKILHGARNSPPADTALRV